MATLDPVLKVHQSMRRQNSVNLKEATKMQSKNSCQSLPIVTDFIDSVLFFRKQEKEQRKSEKEARKVEEKLAKQKEKEAAKLEKQYRHTISRSSERVTNRSGSFERRKSGDGEMVVLNQSTVHG